MTPTLLLILDGWGNAASGPGNAVSLAATPNMDRLLSTCPHAELLASGRDVGLPAGYMGNSEVGHLNIGAGRVVYQDMARIDVALEDGSLAANPVLNDLLSKVRASGGCLHLAGLLSDGGVHSHIRHLEALCSLAAKAGVPVRIHCILDGRDTVPGRGREFLASLLAHCKALPDAAIASMIGRFYAMDRDQRWERVKVAWDLMAHGQAEGMTVADDAVQAFDASFAAGVTDEFVKPVLMAPYAGGMADGDALFLFNFRADRMREITRAFIDPAFDGFGRGRVPDLCAVASMTAYDAQFTIPVAFPKEAVHMGLGEVVSRAGMRQLRLAETEKYAHVTYFFNGGSEDVLPGEERILVPSPRDVETYDLKPAMSAREVTDSFVQAWALGKYDLVVCNLANGDMVGHTGVLKAAIEACEVVDECLGRMAQAVRDAKGRMLVVADHGNCEVMLSPDGKASTSHTTNTVPCVLLDCSANARPLSLADGRLADIAPTLLDLWGMDAPVEMSGVSLVQGGTHRG